MWAAKVKNLQVQNVSEMLLKCNDVSSLYYRLTCGLAGALFVYTHRKIVDLSAKHESSKFNRFLAKRYMSRIIRYTPHTMCHTVVNQIFLNI